MDKYVHERGTRVTIMLNEYISRYNICRLFGLL